MSRCTATVVGRLPVVALAGAVFAWIASGTAGAAVKGEIRLHFATEPPVWVGQQVTLNLDLLTNGFSFGDQQFLLPEISGGFLLQTDTTTIKLTERRGSETWQVLRYPLTVFPERPGQITVPEFRVRFAASAGFGQEPQRFSILTEPVSVDVTRPPGLEGDGLLVTTSKFDLQTSWTPRSIPEAEDGTATARLGDALTLEVTQSAADISGMVLPSLPVYRAPGLSAYPKQPRVEDKVARGALVGSRTDSVTWVFEQPGRYAFPEIRYRWFDPASRQVRESLVSGRVLNVVALPGDSAGVHRPGSALAHRRGNWGWMALPALLLAVGAWVLWRFPGQGFDVFGKRSKRQREEGEPALFKAALGACRRNDVAGAYAALCRWVQACGQAPGSKTLLAVAAEVDPAFQQSLESLQRALSRGGTWDGAQLAARLPQIRRQRLLASPRLRGAALAPLNPGKA